VAAEQPPCGLPLGWEAVAACAVGSVDSTYALAGIIVSAINIGLSLVGGIVYAIFVAAMVASHP